MNDKISTEDLLANWNSATHWMKEYAQMRAAAPQVERLLLETSVRLDERGVDPTQAELVDDVPDNVVELVPDGDDSEG